MIVWVNGAFGVGKTSTVRELQELLPDSTEFDPESVGVYLRYLLPAEDFASVGDFQDLAAWRSLVPDVAAALLAQHPGTLIVPMTLLRQDYRDEVFGALAARRIPVHHLLLHAEETILRKRIEEDQVERGARQWRLDHLDRYREALAWLEQDAATVDTTDLTPRQAAERVAELVRSGAARCPIVEQVAGGRDTVAAAVLFFDEQGRVLLVDPVYKPGWEFPGGVVEDGESPRSAAVREVAEELGLAVPASRLRPLLTDWEPHRGPRSGGLRLVFDGGGLSAEQQAQLALPEDELRDWRFMAREEWTALLPANKRDRLEAALRCRAERSVGYLEAGDAVEEPWR
ncbi:NUDIX hydrolase [Streptacidiphilus carbonis]|uniref:NUDIX hydrolase n=1 Tax=Streptacidiphilus carbonis TaxID=105422 RepID=UPI0005AA2C3C|nr:NUDIX hydrolase [Streptacidiphilus carbonis]